MLVPHNIPFKIVKRGRGRLKNLLSALIIAIAAITAAAAVILRILTSEPSPFLLDLLIKRLLMLTTVKALKCIKCINSKIISKSNKNCYNCDTSVIRYLRYAKGSYSNCTAAFAAINTAFNNFLALNAAFSKSITSSPGGLTSKSKGFKSSPDSFVGFAFALKTFNLNIAFIRLNSLIAANRGLVTRSASSILSFPFALALAAFVAPIASAAPVAPVALIIVASFTLVVALAAFTAALAVAITLAKRRAKYMRAIKAFRRTRERLVNLRA
ncbi:hypothetical protein MBM_03134 [Drepanopeziza brunnea f. sp. 'multigermtubi' MB_m1]|uniref:Uncharacterized protein n=1 Tax=Marssonina brunnea f. sp. multigermtubi (strain MB_m1) TaxID=1072389 RepID=K1X1J7_MARBU|nr:uncharacterized protein MBM_03134 [Drepanopeziza brunnea f. sp. 'multigermtubi' MB_m1]EKD18892.1 hypothetical protein MBM_03134 [Drepanopeziza brunnea f. sp. 'multigermtubi' MB_m1]